MPLLNRRRRRIRSRADIIALWVAFAVFIGSDLSELVLRGGLWPVPLGFLLVATVTIGLELRDAQRTRRTDL